jgi:hypothetical protein
MWLVLMMSYRLAGISLTLPVVLFQLLKQVGDNNNNMWEYSSIKEQSSLLGKASTRAGTGRSLLPPLTVVHAGTWFLDYDRLVWQKPNVNILVVIPIW